MRWSIGLLVALLAFALYAPTARNEFVTLDDERFIYQNPRVLRGFDLHSAGWALRSTENANWYPLTRLSHLLDVSLFGTWAGGHHLVSAAWHAAAAALLFAALHLMTGSLWRSLVVAALFAAHPLQVETVAWAAERSNVLAGFFFALTLLLWARHLRSPRPERLAAALIVFALGLTAKPVLVSLPLVLLLLDAWPFGRLNATGSPSGRPARARYGRLLMEKAPFFLLSAAASAVTLTAQMQVGTVGSLDRYPLDVRLANAALSLWLYLKRLVWPADLAVYYPHQGTGLSFGSALAAGAFLAALSLGVWFQARRRPWLAAGWLWFLATMMPVIGVVQIGSQALADRYAYLPLIGIMLALVWTLAGLAPPAVLAAGAVAAVLSLGAVTVAYSSLWKDSETLYRRTLAVTRGNWVIENNLGLVLAAAGRLEEAVEHYRNALALRPFDARVHNNCGVALRSLKRFDAAAAHFREALRLQPDYAKAFNNLMTTLDEAGRPATP